MPSAHFVDENETLRRNLERVVETRVILNSYEVEQNVLTVKDATCCLIAAMRHVDDLFDAICQRTIYTGSYYEGLRVSSPNEFDLNIVIRLPFKKEDVMIAIPDAESPYLTYQLRQSAQTLLIKGQKFDHPYTELLNFFDDERFLVRTRVQSWFHSAIERALKDSSLKWPRTIESKKLTWFAPSISPAFTCQFISARTGNKIDVDFSPVIDACQFNTPKTMYKSPRFTQIVNQPGQKSRGWRAQSGQPRRVQKVVARSWFLVPKALTKKGAINDETQWRMAFPEAEKLILHDTGCLRKMIKIFKLLRDSNEEWVHPISSYYIKTFFLHEFDANPSLEYWSDQNVGTIFMKMLEAFKSAIGHRFIPYYFNPDANLLYKLDPEIASNIYNRIERITNLLKHDPDNIQKIFN